MKQNGFRFLLVIALLMFVSLYGCGKAEEETSNSDDSFEVFGQIED